MPPLSLFLFLPSFLLLLLLGACPLRVVLFFFFGGAVPCPRCPGGMSPPAGDLQKSVLIGTAPRQFFATAFMLYPVLDVSTLGQTNDRPRSATQSDLERTWGGILDEGLPQKKALCSGAMTGVAPARCPGSALQQCSNRWGLCGSHRRIPAGTQFGI